MSMATRTDTQPPALLASPGGVAAEAPLGVTRALHRLLTPGDRMFNPEAWGSWFELRFPRNPTFVDSPIEVFPRTVWSQYVEVSAGLAGWQAVLDQWRVQVLVADRGEQSGLLRVIGDDPDWRQVHGDAQGVVFVQASPLSRD
jgi:hypothetical protein